MKCEGHDQESPNERLNVIIIIIIVILKKDLLQNEPHAQHTFST